MKDHIKQSLIESFEACQRLIIYKEENHKKSNKNHEEFKQQQSKSFIDIVFNYFTEATQDGDDKEKNQLKKEKEIAIEMRKKLLHEDKEENY